MIHNANYTCHNDNSNNMAAMDVSDQNLNDRILFGTLASDTENSN